MTLRSSGRLRRVWENSSPGRREPLPRLALTAALRSGGRGNREPPLASALVPSHAKVQGGQAWLWLPNALKPWVFCPGG